MPHKTKLTITSLSVPVELIERRIYLIRGQKVMIDFDLAELYGVPTKRLNEQVTRNKKRFPGDFMFRLTKEEAESLRSQFATSNTARGGRQYELLSRNTMGQPLMATPALSQGMLIVRAENVIYALGERKSAKN
jgi:hypothetical protein